MVRVPLIVVVLLGVLALAPSAHADIGVSGFAVTPSTTAAGAHPDVTITSPFTGGEDPKDVRVHLPPGLIGNPKAASTCTDAQFNSSSCPAGSQVGDATVVASSLLGTVTATGGVFNLVPHAGEPARLGSIVHAEGVLAPVTPDIRVQFPVTLRPGDFGLDTTITDLPNQVPVLGIPQDITITSLGFTLRGMVGGTPFMTNPTSCQPAQTTIEANSYQSPAATASASSTYTPTDCGSVPFAPTMGLALETSKADAPSGYTVTIGVPGTETPLRQAHVKRTDVVLPEGTTLSPGNADGLVACTDDEFGVGQDAPAACPDASQIGTVAFDTPLLGTLGGKVFFGTPSASSPLRLFVAVEDPASGLRIKLPGNVTPDPGTGRLTTVFDDLPQVPFTSFKLTFRGGPKAVLANPAGCGTYTAQTRMVPWSGGADANPSATFTIDDDGAGGACPASRPFRPLLSASVGSTQAGEPTGPFSLTVERPDRDQRLRSLSISLPPGLAGVIAGRPTCPDDKASIGACPDESRVGTVSNTVGTGDNPITLTGPVFLGGPYKSGVASLIAVVPAKVGPLDLGNVVLRNALSLRSSDGGVDVRSDDLPSLLGGIPVAVRKLTITLDKPGFLSNPTSCATQPIVGRFTAAGGDTAESQAPYQATGCDKLPFAPKVTGIVGENGAVLHGSRPSITTAITQAPGQSTTKRATVALPVGLGPDLDALGNACPAPVAAAGQCPDSALLGKATAVTPLLPIPLSGPVWLVQVPGQLLPGLEVDLGPIVSLKLTGTFELTGGRVSSTFDGLPDVPLSRFELALNGGLQATTNLCEKTPPSIDGDFADHNGRGATDSSAVVVASCGPAAKVKVSGVKKGKPTVTLTVTQGSGAPNLRSVKLALPKGLTGNRKAAKKGALGKTAARKLSRRAVKVGKRAVSAKLPAGTRTFKLTLRKGAVKATRKLRKRAGKAIAYKVTVADAGGKRTTLSVKAASS